MIITGGENVYPSEIEETIGEHPDVFDLAVIGLPDDKWGEKVVAVIIPREDSESELDEKTIIDFCRDKLAGFKRPKKYYLLNRMKCPVLLRAKYFIAYLGKGSVDKNYHFRETCLQ